MAIKMNEDWLDALTYGMGAMRVSVDDFTMLKPTKFYQDIVDAMQSTYFQKIVKERNMDHILNNIDLINLHINLWQGDKALKTEDLAANGVDVTRLPPGKLASLGCKRTIGREATKKFIAIKRAAHTACAKYGVKFGESGYAVPADRTVEVCSQLKILKDEFLAEKVYFLGTYTEKTEEWIMQNDYEWRDAIRNSLDPVGRVSQVLSFNFSAFKVNPVADTIPNGLEEEVGGLYAQLCKEVRSLASITLKTSYIGKTRAGKRALRPLIAIRNKMTAMNFLDQSIAPVVDEINESLSAASFFTRTHSENIFEGKVFNEVVGLFTKLSSLGVTTEYEVSTETEEEETEIVSDSSPTVAPVEIPDWDF